MPSLQGATLSLLVAKPFDLQHAACNAHGQCAYRRGFSMHVPNTSTGLTGIQVGLKVVLGGNG
eukprot:439377-Pleurochrysis_carterae.AAC.2